MLISDQPVHASFVIEDMIVAAKGLMLLVATGIFWLKVVVLERGGVAAGKVWRGIEL